MKQARKSILFISFIFLLSGGLFGGLRIVPSTFDFGWCPDNAMVSCDFTIKNTGEEIVPLEAIKPSCGCTTSAFTPGELTSQEERTVSLTFNTRGYTNSTFKKPARVKTGETVSQYKVYLKGHVTNSEALVVPVGTGIAEFTPKTRGKKRVIPIENRTEFPIVIEIIQLPAEWAEVKLKKDRIQPGETVDLVVKVSKGHEEKRTTSLTLEAIENTSVHRLTVAIRTGPSSPSFRRRIKPPSKSSGVDK